MQENEYKQKYEQLQQLQNNSMDDFKLYLIKQIQTSQYKTAKKISLYDCSNETQDKILNEVKILKQLSHPHVIKYYDVFLQAQDLILLLEFCEEGDLQYYSKRKKQKKQLFSQKLILSWILQILMGLEYVHSKNIIHRMVCLRNIYMNHQGDLKLGSFGGAKMLQNTLQKALTVVGAPCDLSPQVVEGKSYDNKIDIWALGCVIYELATQKHPFKIKNLPQLYDKIVKNPPEDLPIKYSKYLNPIYKKMMKKNPVHRPSASQLLQQQVFIRLMKQYTKKKKIDSLDLRQIIPKQLLTHKNKKTSLPALSSARYSNLTQSRTKEGQSQKKSSQNPMKAKSRQKSKQKATNGTSLNLTQSKFPNISNKNQSINSNQGTIQSPKKSNLPHLPKPQKKLSIKTPIKKEKQQQNEQKQAIKLKQVSKVQKQTSQSKTNQQTANVDRLTQPDLLQGEYISLLCQIKLQLLQKKYSPIMSQIFQQTVQFDQIQ